jgi:hypothetical protein
MNFCLPNTYVFETLQVGVTDRTGLLQGLKDLVGIFKRNMSWVGGTTKQSFYVTITVCKPIKIAALRAFARNASPLKICADPPDPYHQCSYKKAAPSGTASSELYNLVNL